MNRDQAMALLKEHTRNEGLIKHALAVEAAMRHFAKKSGEDEEVWGVVGLLHDFDYEEHPAIEEHSLAGGKILEALGVEAPIVRAIKAHNDYHGIERNTPLEKTLFAVDELCGFIVACALVRPTKLEGLAPKSVKKKMKTSAFAAAVSRDDIRNGAELLEIPLDDHIRNCVEALQTIAGDLDLA